MLGEPRRGKERHGGRPKARESRPNGSSGTVPRPDRVPAQAPAGRRPSRYILYPKSSARASSGLRQKLRPVCQHPFRGEVMKLRRALFSAATILAAGILTAPANAAPADPGRDKVAAQIHANHEQSLQRLRDWIKLPTIANMN